MSEEIKCISCFQPDMPFIAYYIFNGNQTIKIYHDPTDLETSIITEEQANKEIDRFDLLMAGGNPDEN